jgi:hypothetical protein
MPHGQACSRENRVLLYGALIKIDDASGKAIKIQRVAKNL